MNKEYLENPNKMKEDLLDVLLDLDDINTMEHALGMDKVGSHADIHMIENQGIKEMIREIIECGKDNKEKSGAGSYSGTKEDAMEIISGAALQKLDEIIEWVVKDRFLFKDKNEYSRMAFSVNFSGAPTGIILKEYNDGCLHELESHSARLVLTRDRSCEYGFRLTTSYPPADEYAKETGRVFTREQIIKNKLYDFDDKMREAAFYLNGKKGFYSEYQHDLRSYEPCIRIVNRPLTIYLREDGMAYYKDTNKKRVRISREKIKELNPKLLDVADQAADIIGLSAKERGIIHDNKNNLCTFEELITRAEKEFSKESNNFVTINPDISR